MRARQYSALACVVWDVCIRSRWRRGFGPWADMVRESLDRGRLLAAKARRRCLAAAWRGWRGQADDLYAERHLDGVVRLQIRGMRVLALVKRWRTYSQLRARLRRLAGKTVPRRR